MRVVLVVCAQSAIIDQQSNALSIINIFQEISSPSFPFAIGGFAIASLITREEDEAENPTDLTLRMHLGNDQIMKANLDVNFQGRLALRHIGNIQGMLITEPGELVVSVNQGTQQLGSWSISIMQIGQPVLTTEATPAIAPLQ
jgi:hypothetical protein